MVRWTETTFIGCVMWLGVLASPQHVEREFAHGQISEMGNHSVQTPEVLDTSNRLLGTSLMPGHSQCFLCHDEPQFLEP